MYLAISKEATLWVLTQLTENGILAMPQTPTDYIDMAHQTFATAHLFFCQRTSALNGRMFHRVRAEMPVVASYEH
jgi:hypothetical protein